MKEELQRMAIAKAMGWEKKYSNMYGKKCWYGEKETKVAITQDQLPDYLNDLNAMHEVLCTLPDNTGFTAHLDQFIYEDNGRLVSKMDRVKATARQLAKAYLTTIGKWKA